MSEPVTKEEFTKSMAGVQDRFEEVLVRLEKVETALLTAFHGYAQGVSSRFKKLEITAQTVDERMAALEDRVLELETRRRAS